MKITDKRTKFNPDKYVQDDYGTDEIYIAEDLNTKDSDKAEQAILAYAKNHIGAWFDYFSVNNEKFRMDLMFLFVDQWNSNDRYLRNLSQKPVLMFNFLYAIVMQLLGEQRLNSPAPRVRATKPNVSQEAVDLRDDLLRQIFWLNKAPVIFQTAFMYALGGGYGAWLVELDYENPKTFDLAIKLREIPDPRTCFWDPDALESDKSDGMFSGFFTAHTPEQFHMLFPNAKSDLSFMVTSGYNDEYARIWRQGKKINIAHFWVKEEYNEEVVQLSNGESMTAEEAKELLIQQDKLVSMLRKSQKFGAQVPASHLEKVEIERQRSSVCYKIRHYKMIADEILEVREWPSDYLPVVFLDCQSFVLDGQQTTNSIHKFAQDEQRYLNYIRSEAAEAMLNLNHGNWVGTPKNIEGKIGELWRNPQRSKAILLANYDEKGNLPQFVPPPSISTSFETQFQQGVMNVQQIMGRYDDNRGQETNADSGKAVKARQNAGNLSAFVPFNNLERAVEQTGRICVSLFPAVFDATRPMMVRGKNGGERSVMLNEPSLNGEYKNDMSVTGFDVTIETGGSFALQREAAMEQLQEVMALAPQLAAGLMDKYVENLDVENMPDIVERVQEMMLGIPIPQIISKETGKQIPPAPPGPPNPQMAAVQQKQQQSKMDFQVHQAQQEIDREKLTLQSQQMVQDSINDHAKNLTDVMAMNQKLQADLLRSKTELTRAHMGHKTDLVKHISSMLHQAKTNEQTQNSE